MKSVIKSIPGLVLPEIIYNVKKKLGCIFVENHNTKSLISKRGQTIEIVTSYVVTQEEQGQALVERSDAKLSVTGESNDKDTHIGGASVGHAVKKGRKADSVQSIENRKATIHV